MEVQLIEAKVMVPKEMNDVKELFVQLAKDIKAKKGVAEVAAGSLPKLMAAFDGFDQLDDEIKHPAIGNVVALMAAEIVGVFMAKEA